MAENQGQIPVSKVYETIGQLYFENLMLAERDIKQSKELSEAKAYIQTLERQIKIVQDENGNGSSQEE